MNFRLKTILITATALLMMLCLQAFAGNGDKAGTTAAPELLIPIGARDLAMGGSTIASSQGIEATYWNPAGLAHLQSNASAMFSRLSYIAGIDVNYVAVAGNFGGFGTLGLTIKNLNFGSIPITTEDFPDGTGGTVDPTFLTVGLNYARNLSDRVSVGFTANFISEDLAEVRVSATGFSFSAGVQYQDFANVSGLDFGVAVKNIGPQMGFDGTGLIRQADLVDVTSSNRFVKIEASSDELPSTIELGLAYTFNAGENSKVLLAGTYQNNNFSDDQTKFGLEYTFNDMFFLRGGYDASPNASGSEFIYGGSFGLGVNLQLGGVDVTADYGWRQSDLFDNQNAFSLKLNF